MNIARTGARESELRIFRTGSHLDIAVEAAQDYDLTITELKAEIRMLQAKLANTEWERESFSTLAALRRLDQ